MKGAFFNALLIVRESAWVLFGFFVITAVGFSLILGAIPNSESFTSTTTGSLLLNALIYTVALIVIVFPTYLKRSKSQVLMLLGIRNNFSWSILWRPGFAWLGYMLATIVAGIAVRYLVPWIDSDQAQDVGFNNITLPIEYVLAFLALVILPPIAEELIFRGYLFGKLRSRLGVVGTTIIVSLLFGFVHMQWNVAVDTAILSIFLCYLREKTGSIWACMVLHAIKNGLAYFILFIAPLLGLQLLQ